MNLNACSRDQRMFCIQEYTPNYTYLLDQYIYIRYLLDKNIYVRYR